MSGFILIPARKVFRDILKSVGILAIVLSVGSCNFFTAALGADEYEPNDSIQEAYPVILGESYDAYIAEDDADFFSFQTAHGSTTFDEVEISVSNAGPDLKIGIAVYNPDGVLISRKTTNTGGANLRVTLRDLQADDACYVRFSGTWGTTGWEVDSYGDNHSRGPYSFTVNGL